MDKIVVKNQRIFAGSSGATGNISQFGSYKAGATIYSEDISTLQNLSAWTTGMTGACSATNVPTIQDLNALFYVLTRQLAYLMQSGIPEWKATITYYIGSIVSNCAGDIYISVIDDNLNQALTDSTKWVISLSDNITTAGANYTPIASDNIINVVYTDFSGFTLPAPSPVFAGRKFWVRTTSATEGYNLGYGFICNGEVWAGISQFSTLY